MSSTMRSACRSTLLCFHHGLNYLSGLIAVDEHQQATSLTLRFDHPGSPSHRCAELLSPCHFLSEWLKLGNVLPQAEDAQVPHEGADEDGGSDDDEGAAAAAAGFKAARKQLSAAREVVQRDAAQVQRLLEECHKLDYEDIVAGMPTRFKYRQVCCFLGLSRSEEGWMSLLVQCAHLEFLGHAGTLA